MKTVRLLTIVLAFFVAFSAWTPAPVLAMNSRSAISSMPRKSLDAKKKKKGHVTLIIKNYTGGIIYIRLYNAEYSYNLVATKQGFNNFVIHPGRYTYVLTSSKCGGVFSKVKNLEAQTSLGSYSCKK